MKKYFNKICRRIITLSLLTLVLIVLTNGHVNTVSSKNIYTDKNTVPHAQAALILGARVYNNGTLSHILLDRTITALRLYKEGKVDKILVSGDHGREEYDEVNAVKNYLLKQGVKPEDIFLDHAGFDTYDSLYRAKAIFNIKAITITSQSFHLPRAVYIGTKLDIKTYGISADLRQYRAETRNQLREIPAKVKAFLNITFQSKPQFLGNQIPISGSGKASWD